MCTTFGAPKLVREIEQDKRDESDTEGATYSGWFKCVIFPVVETKYVMGPISDFLLPLVLRYLKAIYALKVRTI